MEYHEEFKDDLFVGRGFLENGKKEGLWYYFYETGELKQEIEYANGIENGSYKFFCKNGNIGVKCNRINGQNEGLWQEYYENGKPEEEGEYIDNNYSIINFWDKNGKQILTDGTGMKIAEYGYGSLLDVYEQYFENRKFIKEIKIQGYTILGFESEGYKSQENPENK